jgi:hypothetical protein
MQLATFWPITSHARSLGQSYSHLGLFQVTSIVYNIILIYGLITINFWLINILLSKMQKTKPKKNRYFTVIVVSNLKIA